MSEPPAVSDGDGVLVGRLVDEISSMVGDPVEARWIVAQALDLSVSSLAVRSLDPVSAAGRSSALAMASRRSGGEPLQHVLGTWGFRRLDVLVDGRALIPRPETEEVVGVALEEAWRMADTASGLVRGADLGTGSGVIALSLAMEGPPSTEVWATERSEPAMELARANLERLAASLPEPAGRVHLALGSWFEPLPAELQGTLGLVVANPPYVSDEEWESLEPVVRLYDPRQALVAGPSGLEALRAIATEAVRWLSPHGVLVMEMAPSQAGAMTEVANASGYGDVEVRRDLAGRDRVLVARRSAR